VCSQLFGAGDYGFNPTIRHADDPLAKLVNAGVVGDDDDGSLGIDGDASKQFHHIASGLRVKSGGRFIANENAGLMDQSAGDGDSLLLPSRQLGREGVGSSAQTDGFEHFPRCGYGLGSVFPSDQ
jgi:hypothetical protein